MIKHFVYCFRAASADIAKVGYTGNPRDRLQAVGSCLPFSLEILRVFQFSTHQVAKHWERELLSCCDSHDGKGEWVKVTQKLFDTLNRIDGVDVTDQYHVGRAGRKLPAPRKPIVREISANSPEAYQAQLDVIHMRLGEGFGAEDCLVMDRIPAQVFRAEVDRLRKAGLLASYLFPQTNPRRHARNATGATA